MVRSALARVSNHDTILILRDAAKRPLLRMRASCPPNAFGNIDGHRRQTVAAAAASPEMAGLRPARTGPDDPLRHPVLRLLAVGDLRHRHPHHRSSLAVAAGG